MRRTITIPDELDKRIVESAKRNIRPIGSEVSYIVQLWFNHIDSLTNTSTNSELSISKKE